MANLVYLYAVLEPSGDVQLEGIDGARVRLLVEDGLAAAVSNVPAADFDEEPLNERVRDMQWLGPRAIAHQDVNARLHAAFEAVLPLQFGAVFRDEQRVRAHVAERRDELARRLDAVRGCDEYVVVVHRVRPLTDDELASASEELRSLLRELETSPPGRAYLLGRRVAEVRQQAEREADEAAARLLVTALDSTVVDVYPEVVPADADDRPLARLSLLVARAEAAALQRALAATEWEARGLRVTLTGPWPPYRFSGVERAQASGAS